LSIQISLCCLHIFGCLSCVHMDISVSCRTGSPARLPCKVQAGCVRTVVDRDSVVVVCHAHQLILQYRPCTECTYTQCTCPANRLSVEKFQKARRTHLWLGLQAAIVLATTATVTLPSRTGKRKDKRGCLSYDKAMGTLVRINLARGWLPPTFQGTCSSPACTA
jgi:hypothetical protein